MKLSLKTLPEATAQQVFDHVTNHLLTQRKKSKGGSGDQYCVYRNSEKNLSCAAGCLISDDEYQERFECANWGDLVESNAVPKAHSQLIQRLQSIHDASAVFLWKNKLNKLANNLGLDFNFPQHQ